MRLAPPPLSVTFPSPSSTTSELVLRTLAVACIMIVTGLAPQSKVITPPLATAATTAADVQPAAVPLPITWSGCEVSTGRAAAGTSAPPAGFPASCRGGAGAATWLRLLRAKATDPASPAPAALAGEAAMDRPGDGDRAVTGAAAVPQAASKAPEPARARTPEPAMIRTRPHASHRPSPARCFPPESDGCPQAAGRRSLAKMTAPSAEIMVKPRCR